MFIGEYFVLAFHFTETITEKEAGPQGEWYPTGRGRPQVRFHGAGRGRWEPSGRWKAGPRLGALVQKKRADSEAQGGQKAKETQHLMGKHREQGSWRELADTGHAERQFQGTLVPVVSAQLPEGRAKQRG